MLTADIAGELIEGIHRHEQFVGLLAALAGGVFQNEVLPPGPADGALDHLDEPADTVLVVHHQITGGQCEWVHGIAAFGRQPSPLGAGGPVPGEVGLGDHHQLGAGHNDSPVQRALEHVDHARPQRRTGVEHHGGSIAFTELLDQSVRGPDTRGHHRSSPTGQHVGAQHGENLVGAALLAPSRRRGAHPEIDRAGLAELADRPPSMAAGPGQFPYLVEGAKSRAAQCLDIDRCVAADRGHRPGGFEELLSGLDQVGGAGADLLRVAYQQRRAGRQVVDEQAEPLGVQHRGQRLHTVDRDSFGEFGQHVTDPADDVLIIGRGVGRQCGCARTYFVGQQQFAAGHGDDRTDFNLGYRALVGDGEHPYLGDLVAPEFHPHRMFGGGREDVEDPAADRELAASAHHVDAGVGEFDQTRG